MRSQAGAASPMAGQGAGPIAWEPGGLGWSAAAVESPPLTLPAATPAAAPFPRLRGSPTHGSGGSRCGEAAPAFGSPWAHGSRPGLRGTQVGRRPLGDRPPGAAADHGAETWSARCLRGGVLLRQSAGEIPALFLQHALLGEARGVKGHLGCRASSERQGGLPVAREGRPGLSGAQEPGERCRLVFWAGDTSGASLLGRNSTVAPCPEGTLRGGITLVARDEGLAGMRICVRPKKMCLGKQLAGQPHGHISWLGTFRPGCWKARLPKRGSRGRREGRETPSLPSPIPQANGSRDCISRSLLQASVSAPVKAEKG